MQGSWGLGSSLAWLGRLRLSRLCGAGLWLSGTTCQTLPCLMKPLVLHRISCMGSSILGGVELEGIFCCLALH
eukprot:12926117-Prorocentrum_lima.AAC.1